MRAASDLHPPPPPPGLSLQAMDDALLAAWQQFAQLLGPGQPLAVVQQRFASLGLFPKLVWPWLAGGEALALQCGDVTLLHGTLVRVLACAHACWGRPDAQGWHAGGEDHCAAFTPALHALALGPAYAAAVFHPGRQLSAQGYPARRHAANLLVRLHHPGWAHADRALALARAYAHGKSGSQADRALVATLLALATGDADGLCNALPQFAAAYRRSDWGRHLPERQPIAVANLLALARRHVPPASVAPLAAALLSPQRAALWQAFAEWQAKADAGAAQPLMQASGPVPVYAGELAFLGEVPGLGAAA